MVENRLIIFDTTLRDGEQSPGASMNLSEKLEVARALRDLGVDVMEVGFPAASSGDFDAVRLVAREIQGPVICAMARCNADDIERAWEALRDAGRSRLHVFIDGSPIMREQRLHVSCEQVAARTVQAIQRARVCCADVQFTIEDAARTEPDFVCQLAEKAIEAGAATVNLSDTAGYAVPEQWAGLVRQMQTTVRGADRATLGVHCWNDLGLAVANSLAALREGARQVGCTINGLGERAGTCALEEIVMAVRTRQDHYHLQTSVNSRQLYHTSRLVAHVTGVPVQRNKAIVGQNAFTPLPGEAAGTTDERGRGEVLRGEEIGLPRTSMVLGRHSGRQALRQRIRDLGYHLTENQMPRVFEAFKQLAERKKTVYDADLEALAETEIRNTPALWTLESFHCSAGSGSLPMAAVALRLADGERKEDAACGDGPVDAIYKAIERMTRTPVQLRDYSVRNVSMGEDAQCDVQVEVEHDGKMMRGRAISTDVLEASARAFLDAINRINAPRQNPLGMQQVGERGE
jgi:2-isopropylmalate synthase